jgi:hypothetical protein
MLWKRISVCSDTQPPPHEIGMVFTMAHPLLCTRGTVRLTDRPEKHSRSSGETEKDPSSPRSSVSITGDGFPLSFSEEQLQWGSAKIKGLSDSVLQESLIGEV